MILSLVAFESSCGFNDSFGYQIGCTKNESCWSKKIAKKVSSKEVNDCNVDDLHFFEV